MSICLYRRNSVQRVSNFNKVVGGERATSCITQVARALIRKRTHVKRERECLVSRVPAEERVGEKGKRFRDIYQIKFSGSGSPCLFVRR